MIEIKNLAITFEETIMNNVSLSIASGDTIVFTGESGSGKTSLLNVLALLSLEHGHDYYYNDEKIDLHNEKIITNFRKNIFGYVTQRNTLFDDMTVMENLYFFSKLADKKLRDSKLIEFLELVNLDNPDSLVKSLSGGEKRRLLLACILAKNPEVYILDEPFNGLDDENKETISRIINRLSAKGKTVILATHELNAIKYNKCYQIKNDELLLLNQNNITEAVKANKIKEDTKLTLKSMIDYSLKRIRKKSYRYILLTFIIAIAVTITSFINNMYGSIIIYYKEYLKMVSTQEIQIINVENYEFDTHFDSRSRFEISSNDLNQIRNINEVDSLYPLYWFPLLNPYKYYLETNGNFSFNEQSITIDTHQNNQSISVNFDSDISIAIIPYFEEQHIELFAEEIKDVEGILISQTLADALNLNSIDNTSLSFDILIPVAEIESFIESEQIKYDARYPLYAKKTVTFPIKGIYNSSWQETYVNEFEDVMLLSIDQLIKLNDEIATMYDKAKQIFSENNPCDKKSEYCCIRKDQWEPSSYIAFVNQSNDLEFVMDKIQEINTSLYTKGPVIEQQNQIDRVNEQRQSITLMTGLLSLTVIIVITIIFAYTISKRKNEHVILLLHGLSKKNIVSTIFIEFLFLGILTFVSSMIMTTILNNFARQHMLFLIEIVSIYSVIPITIISILAVIIPTICSNFIINTYSIDLTIRT